MPIGQGQARREISNRLLLTLPPASLRRLEQQLEPLELEQGASIYRVGSRIRWLYFINRGFVSIVKTMQDGRTVEIGTTGNNDVVGLFGVYGVEIAAWDTIVQVPGSAFRLNSDALRAEVDADPAARQLFERYTYLVLSSLAQNAACHRLHSLKQRFCRWLLLAQDSAQSTTLPLTHERLALMLGVQRSGVSIVASALQKQGVLRNHRGRLTILDRNTLENGACECYGTAIRARQQLYGAQPNGE
jgi:CRP-like cAMP-binding protein